MVLTKLKSVTAVNVVVLCCVILTACATAPIQEMSDARQSLQAAHDAGAEKYAQTSLLNAEQALQQAKQNLEQRAFKEARINALRAKTQAMDAQEIALAIGAAHDAVARAESGNNNLPPAVIMLLRRAEEAADQG
jgi:anti-sigma28 factor (negative regulator of flagellin synthesis)